ncbi:MAG: DUF2244 domain-containing protein [Gammaproteobacteria bacterium]
MFFGACLLLSLSIGLGFYSIGLPLVLPFCGVEMIALGTALWVTHRRSRRQEVVCLGAESVTVEVGTDRPERRYEFRRAWARLVLEPAGGRGTRRLTLRSADGRVELGSFLSDEERESLGRALARYLPLQRER